MDDNKRIAPRQKVLKAGRIILEDLHGFDCQLRDISATGAKIMVAGEEKLPDTFRLLMAADSSIRPVKVAWRKPGSIGVHFTGEPKKSLLKI
jgi:PilZ domain